jgi:outer membrane lipase/esterase
MTNANPGFPDDPGTPLGATAGFDFRLTPDWLAGFAVSGGHTRQPYGLGGDFTLNEFTISGYAAYRSGPFWAMQSQAAAACSSTAIGRFRSAPRRTRTWAARRAPMSLLLETGYDFTTRGPSCLEDNRIWPERRSRFCLSPFAPKSGLPDFGTFGT